MRLFDAVVGDLSGGDGLSHELRRADSQLLLQLRELRLKIRAVQSAGGDPSKDEETNQMVDLFFVQLIEREHMALILDEVGGLLP